jgi:hypothetical protein
MRRLCTESSCPYPGRSVSLAVRVPMGVELRAGLKGPESPSNPKGAVVATGAGLRASAKVLESPPDPTVTRAARRAATSGVMGQKSAEAIVTAAPWTGAAVKGRT